MRTACEMGWMERGRAVMPIAVGRVRWGEQMKINAPTTPIRKYRYSNRSSCVADCCSSCASGLQRNCRSIERTFLLLFF